MMTKPEVNSLSPHSAYKPSSVSWLEKVPEHWEVTKLRHILTSAAERNRPDLPLLSVVREKGVILRDLDNPEDNHNIVPEDLTNYKVVHQGQFAMNKMKAWQGSYGVSPCEGVVSPAYFIFDIKGVDGIFFHSAVRSRAYVPFFNQASDGVRIGQWDLAPEQMREIPFLVPPPEEQAAIVRFLDHADEQIQRYIAGKERLIALLEEERQALVHQAVTRGLDPSVRLKPSRMEWLGDVPEHWETARLGSIGRFSKGNGGTKEDEVPVGVPCIRYGDIYTSHKYFIKASRAYIEQEKTSEYTPLRFGDILFAGSGETIEEIGKSAVNLIKEPAYSGGDVIIFRPTVRVNAEFTGYATDSPGAQAQKSIMGRGFTVMHIYGNQLKNIQIALPPIGEQDGIVEHINNGTTLIDDTIARSRRQINLMNEYRTRLIADVVTGQLDVREAAEELPTLEPTEITD